MRIDVNPGNGPACFNNDGRGTIPVAIYGEADLDVRRIDPSTLALEGLPVAANGAGYRVQVKDLDKDGIEDLLVAFEDIAGAFVPGQGTAVVTGALLVGTLSE